VGLVQKSIFLNTFGSVLSFIHISTELYFSQTCNFFGALGKIPFDHYIGQFILKGGRNMNKKLMAILSGCALAAMLVTGCGGNDDNNDTNDTNNTDSNLEEDVNDGVNDVENGVNDGVNDVEDTLDGDNTTTDDNTLTDDDSDGTTTDNNVDDNMNNNNNNNNNQ